MSLVKESRKYKLEKFFSGRYCIHCDTDTHEVSGDMIYTSRPDLWKRKFFMCPECLRFVGTHKDSGKPLGSIADSALATLRKSTHAVFDQLWKDNHMTRVQAYGFLAAVTNRPIDYAHIGMLETESCMKLIEAVNNYLKVCREYEP